MTRVARKTEQHTKTALTAKFVFSPTAISSGFPQYRQGVYEFQASLRKAALSSRC